MSIRVKIEGMQEVCDKCTLPYRCCTEPVALNMIEYVIFRGVVKIVKENGVNYMQPDVKENGDKVCHFFDMESKKCKNYDKRPMACTIYPLMEVSPHRKFKGQHLFVCNPNCPQMNCLNRDTSQVFRSLPQDLKSSWITSYFIYASVMAIEISSLSKEDKVKFYEKVNNIEKYGDVMAKGAIGLAHEHYVTAMNKAFEITKDRGMLELISVLKFMEIDKI